MILLQCQHISLRLPRRLHFLSSSSKGYNSYVGHTNLGVKTLVHSLTYGRACFGIERVGISISSCKPQGSLGNVCAACLYPTWNESAPEGDHGQLDGKKKGWVVLKNGNTLDGDSMFFVESFNLIYSRS